MIRGGGVCVNEKKKAVPQKEQRSQRCDLAEKNFLLTVVKKRREGSACRIPHHGGKTSSHSHKKRGEHSIPLWVLGGQKTLYEKKQEGGESLKREGN